MSTAVWIVMCSEPVMRAPLSGCAGPYSSRHAIEAGHLDLGQLDLLAAPRREREIGHLEVELRGDANGNRSWSLYWSSGSGASRDGHASIHGGRPGSPDDSPHSGPDQALMITHRGCEGLAHGNRHRRRRPGHARLLRPRRHDREGRRAHEGGRRARRRAWSRSPRASCRPTPTGCGGPCRGATATAVVRALVRPGRRRARARRATRSARSRASTSATSRSR